jgi:CheY-like chemotaxis protein
MAVDTQRTVLVVEDAEVCASTLEIAFISLPSVSVKWLRTAEEALDCLAREDITALVTDIHLPFMDGFELIERVRRQPRLSRLPLVVVSGDADPRSPERAFRLGADAWFTKPYSPAEVRHKLEQLIDAA